MSPAIEMMVRGPGVFLVICLAFALTYLLLLFRHQLTGSLLVIMMFCLVREPAELILPLLLLAFGISIFRKMTSVAARAIWGRPSAYAYRKGARRMLPMSRSEVAAEFLDWNKIVEESVALLKRITAYDGTSGRKFNRLSLDASELRKAMIGEQRRIKKLVLSFEDPREHARHNRIFEVGQTLDHELWHASVNPGAYPRHEPHGGWDITYKDDDLGVLPPVRYTRVDEEVLDDERKGHFGLRGALDIEYVDANGERTDRYVEATSIEAKGGKLYLWGWCEKRQARRQFRVDRIVALNDGQTGEVIDPEKITAWLRERAGLDKVRRVA